VRPDRLTWLLGIAQAVGSIADCTRRQVGAVIFDPVNYYVLSTGYNGRAAGLPGCLSEGACPRGALSYAELPASAPYLTAAAGRCDAIHAEDNALRRARERGLDVRGAWLAVTAPPCDSCTALLRHYGIAGAVFLDATSAEDDLTQGSPLVTQGLLMSDSPLSV